MTLRHVIQLASIGLACVWALWPLSPESAPHNRDEARPPPVIDPAVSDSTSVTLGRFDLAAYQTPLWVAAPTPPAPPPPPAPLAPPPPLRLQLLAIVHTTTDAGAIDETAYSVMFYDPDAGKVIVLKAGDAVPGTGTPSTGRSIAAVTARSVQIREPAVSGRVSAISTLTLPVPSGTLPKGGE